MVDILLVEDNPADARLTKEALVGSQCKHNVHTVADGVEALLFLKRRESYQRSPRPDLIILDLNLPKKNGREVLADIKNDPDLCSIPVVILTTSSSEEDITKTYHLHANCYITKPFNIEDFSKVVKTIESFWSSIVQLPSH